LRFIFSNLLFIYLSISSCVGTEERFLGDSDEVFLGDSGEVFLGDSGEVFLGDSDEVFLGDNDSIIRFLVKVLKGIS
jgi:hypothetical protein